MMFLDINTKNKATTQYTGVNFNSMIKFAGKYIAASSEGLHLIEGFTDNGVNIDASMKSGMFDLGVNNMKRMHKFYFGLETTGDLKISIFVNETLAVSYDVTGKADGTQQRITIPIGRKNDAGEFLVGRYWAWYIENVDGCDFSIDSIEVLPDILHAGYKS